MCEGWGILTPGALEPDEAETTGEAGAGAETTGAPPGEAKLETGRRVAAPRELPATISMELSTELSMELSTEGMEQGTWH